MTKKGDADAERSERVERLKQALRKIAREQGLTQKQIAARLGIPPQYLSDVKRNRRAVAELLARRFGQEFRMRHEWLLHGEEPSELQTERADVERAAVSGGNVFLPILRRPCVGDPLKSRFWERSHVELTGPAAAVAGRCSQPYVLRVEHGERGGRLKRDDVVLISQTPNANSQYQIVVHRRLPRLVHLGRDRRLRLLEGGDPVPEATRRVGCCRGIVWASL